MPRRRHGLALLALPLAACGAGGNALTQLSDTFVVAQAAEAAYIARPDAVPAIAARLATLTTAAQLALATWRTSGSPADQATAQATVAALTTFLATQAPALASAARTPGAVATGANA